jgi:hypothetical protein
MIRYTGLLVGKNLAATHDRYAIHVAELLQAFLETRAARDRRGVGAGGRAGIWSLPDRDQWGREVTLTRQEVVWRLCMREPAARTDK